MSRCQLVHDLRKCPVVVGSPQTQTQRDQVTRIIHRLIVQRGLDHHIDDGDHLQDDNPVTSQKKQPGAAGQNRLVLSRRTTKHAVMPASGTSAAVRSNDGQATETDSNTPSGEAKTGQPILSEQCYPNPIPAGLVTVFSCMADNGSSTTTESSDEYSMILTGTGGNEPFAESMDVVVNVNVEEGGHGNRSSSSISSPIRTLAEGCEGLSDVIDRSPSAVAGADERMNVDDAKENSSSTMVQQPVTIAILQQRVVIESPITASHSFQSGQDEGVNSLLHSAQTELDNAMELQQPSVDIVATSPTMEVDCSVRMDDGTSDVDGDGDNKGEDDVRQPEIVASVAAAPSSSSSGPRGVISAIAGVERMEGTKDAAGASSSGSVNSANSSNSKNSNTGRANKNKLRRIIATDTRNAGLSDSASHHHHQHQQQHQQKQDQSQTRDVAAGASPLLRPVPPTSQAGTAASSSSSSGPNRSAISPIRPVNKININVTPSAMSSSSAPTTSRGNSNNNNNSSSSGVNASVVPTPPSGHRSTHTSLRNFGKKQLGHGNAGAPRVSTGVTVTSSVATAALVDQPDGSVDGDGNASSLIPQLDDNAIEK